jgi:hypothetical protein
MRRILVVTAVVGTAAALGLAALAVAPVLPTGSRPAATPSAVVGLTFEGANPDPVVAGNGRLPGVSNYLLGSDPGAGSPACPTTRG